MIRALAAGCLAGAGLLLAACATEGGNAAVYGSLWYDDPWYDWYGYGYGGGCCVDYPGDVGPPHPEHPIVLPPGEAGQPRPEQPIAKPPGQARATPSQPIATPPKAEAKPSTPSSSRPMPSPRPAAMPRGGGGGGRGGRR